MGNPITGWITRRTADGVIVPTARSVRGAAPPAAGGRHWMPATGPLADLNRRLGDPARDLWASCEVRLDADGDLWKARASVYGHKGRESVVGADEPILRELGEILGSPVDVEGWREWRTLAGRSASGLTLDGAHAFADQWLADLAGTAHAARVGDGAGAPVPDRGALRAASVDDGVETPVRDGGVATPPTIATVERQVFIASKIASYPKALQVRHSIKAQLSRFGYRAYIAERDALGGFMQSEIDRMVETSEHMVAIVWDTIGDATRAEVELAMRTAGAVGRPRVHLFVSHDPEHQAVRAEENTRATLTFLERLDSERRYVRFFRGDRDLVDQVADLFASLDL